VILIRKGRPPAALVTYRRTPDTTTDPPRDARYDGPGFEAVKPAVREALVAEQRGVCCYCNDRITPTDTGMKIEHRVPQRGADGDATRDLDWPNLLGACCGTIPAPAGRGARLLHCDSAKGDQRLSLDPTEASHMAAIGYTRGGRVTSSRLEHQGEIDGVLNLNADALVERRTRALSVLQDELQRRYGVRDLPEEKLQKLLAQTRDPSGGALRPFAGFVCWWLERTIRKVSSR
jgi:uncharacterized protein (TIGR02646 family)